VLPGPDYGPALGFQQLPVSDIPSAVLFDLLDPISTIRLFGQGAMDRASVPEAAINEDSESWSPENQVGPNRSALEDSDWMIDSESKSSAMDEGTNS